METIKALVDILIFSVLGFMGFAALWITIERVLFLRRAKPQRYACKTDWDKALTDNLTALYIIYSNAPYVGLLGTVTGIMLTFYDMGTSGSIDAGGIMTGLSLALKATALGLCVAIPTLIAYNALQRAVNVKSESWEQRGDGK
jgi:biopolymer transport protein ExbB